MKFDFLLPTRIIFGTGSASNVGTLVVEFGKRILLVNSHGFEVENIQKFLEVEHIRITPFEINQEPTLELIKMGTIIARNAGIDAIVAVGGGSVMDGAKAISALLTNPGELEDYLEVVGKNQPIRNQPAPVIALPTTAGTGAEVTRNAVLSVPEKKFKVSLRSPMLPPRIAVIDPELTYSLPDEITASTGMDAITQVLEPYVSKKHNSMTDLLCLEGLRCGSQALLKAYEKHDPEARQQMAWCSLLGGIALSNAGLGAVHGFASPIGGMFDIPHGVICARLLPYTYEMNSKVLSLREPENPTNNRFRIVAQIMTNNCRSNIKDGANYLRDLTTVLKIPTLSQCGIQRSDFSAIVEKAGVASSMQANPIKLTASELIEILESAF